MKRGTIVAAVLVLAVVLAPVASASVGMVWSRFQAVRAARLLVSGPRDTLLPAPESQYAGTALFEGYADAPVLTVVGSEGQTEPLIETTSYTGTVLFSVGAGGEITTTGALSLAGDTTLGGNVTVTGTLDVEDDLTLWGDLQAGGDAHIDGGLVITDSLVVADGVYTPTHTLNGEGAYIAGTLEVDGSAYLDGALSVGGDLYPTLSVTEIATDTLATAAGRGTTFYANAGVTTTLTLPAAAAGLSFCFYNYDGSDFYVDVAAGDQIHALTNAAGDRISNTTAGDAICLVAVDDTSWVALSRSGTWSDAN